jgi:hypothetical protein
MDPGRQLGWVEIIRTSPAEAEYQHTDVGTNSPVASKAGRPYSHMGVSVSCDGPNDRWEKWPVVVCMQVILHSMVQHALIEEQIGPNLWSRKRLELG